MVNKMDKDIKYEDIQECRSFQDEEGRWILQAEIEQIPAADVAPIIHGILKYSPQDDIALCSKCGEEIYLGALHQFAHNYCPNCGAKMDGKDRQDG